MKKLIIGLCIVIPLIQLYGQEVDDWWNEPYESGIRTHSFEVLDINWDKQILAFRHVYELQELEVYQPDQETPLKPVNCHYAGMEKTPFAGVILGVYDLRNHLFSDVFKVYSSCYNIEDCTDFEESKANLDSAKLVFSDYGLNIEAKPKKLKFSKQEKHSSTLLLSGINFRTEYFYDMDEFMMVARLFADDQQIYERKVNVTLSFGAEGNIIWDGAYSLGSKVFFLYKMYRTNNMEGPRSIEYFEFTPVFDLDSLRR